MDYTFPTNETIVEATVFQPDTGEDAPTMHVTLEIKPNPENVSSDRIVSVTGQLFVEIAYDEGESINGIAERAVRAIFK